MSTALGRDWRRVGGALGVGLSLVVGARAEPRQTKNPPRPASVVRPAAIEGVVKGPDGKPVAGAVVLARRAEGSPYARDRRTATGGDGRFRFDAPEPGPYDLRIEAPGFAARTIRGAAPGTPHQITLDRGGTLEGTVLDARGAPVAGARIEAWDMGGAFFAGSFASDPRLGRVRGRSDTRGRFRLEGLPPGLLGLTASATGMGFARRASLRAGDRVQLILAPGSSLSGTVFDPSGKPAAGVVVQVEPEDPGSQRSFAAPQTTDARGRFEIGGLVAGSFTLAAQGDQGTAVVTDLDLPTAGDVTADVRLWPGTSVTGRLLGPDGQPLQGLVRIETHDGRRARALADRLRAETSPDGRFRLEAIPPGSYVFQVQALGHAWSRAEATIRAKDAAVNLGDIVLGRGPAIRGRVVDGAGVGIAQATVSAASVGKPGLAEAVSAPNGTFTVSGLETGGYRLSASAAGFVSATREVESPADDVEVLLDRAGAIVGSVVDPSGKPAEVRSARAERTGGGHRASLRRIGAGLVFEDLPAGLYTVVVDSAQGHAVVQEAAVVGGATTDLGQIRLGPGCSIRGTAVDTAGAPVPGATVVAQWADGSSGTASTDLDGGFEIGGVPPGKAAFSVSHPLYVEGPAGELVVDPAATNAITLVLLRAARIQGSARHRDGAPLPRARVRVEPAEGARRAAWPETSVREDGRFAMERVPPGQVTVWLQPKGASTSVSREIEVGEGQTAEVDLVFEATPIRGTVRRQGVPAVGIDVFVRTGHRSFGTRTDVQGRYALAAAPGPATLHAGRRGDNGASTSREVVVPDSGVLEVDLEVTAWFLGLSAVEKETRRPLTTASFTVSTPEGKPVQHASGRWRAFLAPGEYQVRASARGRLPATTVVDLQSSDQDLVLELDPGLTLTGRVVDQSGRGVAGALVEARPIGGGTGQTSMAGSDGVFALSGTESKPYDLVVTSGAGFAAATHVVPESGATLLKLQPGGRIRIVVQGPEGVPLSDIVVGAEGSQNGVAISATGRTDARGTVEMTVPEGEVEVTARFGPRPITARAQVAAGAQTTVRVSIAPGSSGYPPPGSSHGR